jgi:hypothetical protein
VAGSVGWSVPYWEILDRLLKENRCPTRRKTG